MVPQYCRLLPTDLRIAETLVEIAEKDNSCQSDSSGTIKCLHSVKSAVNISTINKGLPACWRAVFVL